MKHLTTAELEAFVAGEAAPDAERVREHVRHCVACAERLAEEAGLDASMRGAAASGSSGGRAPRARTARVWLRRPEQFAIAAGLLVISLGTLWVSLATPPGRSSVAARTSIPVTGDVPGLHERRGYGPGSDVFPRAEAFRDTGSDSPGMRAGWDSLSGTAGAPGTQSNVVEGASPSSP